MKIKNQILWPGVFAALFLAFQAQADWRSDRGRGPGDMRAVRDLARQVDNSARMLLDEARESRSEGERMDWQGRRAFSNFAENAAEFESEVEENMDSPRQTVSEFGELKESFEIASRYFPVLYGGQRIAEAKRDATNAMSTLSGLYARGFDRGGRGSRRIDWHQIKPLADAIEREAREVEEIAEKDDYSRWRPNAKDERKRALASLEHLRKVSDGFHDTVKESQDAPWRTSDEMRHLVGDYQSASERIGVFGHRTRRHFQELGVLVDRLRACYESPSRPYDDRPHRTWERRD